MTGLCLAGPEIKIKLGRKPGYTGQWAWKEVREVWPCGSNYREEGNWATAASPSNGLSGVRELCSSRASLSSASLKAEVNGMALTRFQVPLACLICCPYAKLRQKNFTMDYWGLNLRSPHLTHWVIWLTLFKFSMLFFFPHRPRMRIRLGPSS